MKLPFRPRVPRSLGSGLRRDVESLQQRWNFLNGDTPYERASNAQFRELYAIFRPLVEGRPRAVLRSWTVHENVRSEVRFEENPFYHGILAFDATDEFLPQRSQRHRWAWCMLYAHRHEVPASLVIGFIHQAGGADRIIEKMRDGEYELWFNSEDHRLLRTLRRFNGLRRFRTPPIGDKLPT